MTSIAKEDFYLLSTLEFDVGSAHVKLYGAIEVTTTALTFVVAGDAFFDPKLFPPGAVTKSIDAPLGMTGVSFQNFGIQGSIYKDTNDKTVVDVALQAAAVFTNPNLANLNLAGALVLEQMSPRLAVVTLSADRPLTIKDFVESVIGGTWGWVDGVADQFAIKGGYMYYLNPPPNSKPDYTYPWPRAKPTLKFVAGYHLAATLQVFQKYNFVIKLAVVGDAISLSGTYELIDFDFVQLRNSTLEISTSAGDRYLRLSTTAVVFGSSFSITITYDLNQKAFQGSVTADPITVSFTWTQGTQQSSFFGPPPTSGFQITNISGLPLRDELDLIQKYSEILNSLRPSGGCQEILTKWLNEIKTSLSPGFNGSPSRDPNRSGWMILPLKLTYTITAGGEQLDSSTIPFDAHLEIPHSLSDLPGNMWDSLLASAGDIVTAILSNPNTYKAIAEYVSLKYGAQALARFICRALEEIAKELAKLAEQVVVDSLEAAAELAAQLARVALFDLPGIISSLIDLLEELAKKIWNAITGHDDDEKREAIDKVKKQVDQIKGVVANLQNKIKSAESISANDSLRVSLDEHDRYVAKWMIAAAPSVTLGSNVTIQYNLTLLSGEVGTHADTAWHDTQFHPSISQSEFDIPLEQIPDHQQFQFNASLSSSIMGIVFLDAQTHDDLLNAIQQLRDTGVDEINDQADELDRAISVLWNYNQKGISTNPIYATLDMPPELTIGQSRININTRIRNAMTN